MGSWGVSAVGIGIYSLMVLNLIVRLAEIGS